VFPSFAIYKNLLNAVGSSVVDGQRQLAARKRFWDKWAKEHRKLIKQVEETVDLKALAIVSHPILSKTHSDNLLSPLQLKSKCAGRGDREVHLTTQHMHWLQT
jgi:hypothetical protein